MTPRTYQSPKVQPVKVTSAHRPTKIHEVVKRVEDASKAKAERPRRAAD